MRSMFVRGRRSSKTACCPRFAAARRGLAALNCPRPERAPSGCPWVDVGTTRLSNRGDFPHTRFPNRDRHGKQEQGESDTAVKGRVAEAGVKLRQKMASSRRLMRPFARRFERRRHFCECHPHAGRGQGDLHPQPAGYVLALAQDHHPDTTYHCEQETRRRESPGQ
jgi:hypothetical protein